MLPERMFPRLSLRYSRLPSIAHREMLYSPLGNPRKLADGVLQSLPYLSRWTFSSGARRSMSSRLDRLRKSDIPPFSDFLTDGFGRQHDYLRISLTERCNLRCVYCMPEEGVKLSPPEHNLTTPEIIHLASLFVDEGVSKIRLTGGEPTVRKDFIPLMKQLGSLKTVGLRELCVTTNGIALDRKLDAMVDAGLTGLNISLDTLDPRMFPIMTRRNGFDAVQRSIAHALELNRSGAGLKLKINVVVMRGVNDHEILSFVEQTRDKDLEVRFIEYMPFDGNQWGLKKMVPFSEILGTVRSRFPNIEKVVDGKNETSKTYHIPGFVGRVGFITSMTHNFCGTCNRLRITSDGSLKVCLFDSKEVSLRDMLRSSNSGNPIHQIDLENGNIDLQSEELNSKLLRIIGKAVKRKEAGHAGAEALSSMKNRPMILIGNASLSQSKPYGFEQVRHGLGPLAFGISGGNHLGSAPHLSARLFHSMTTNNNSHRGKQINSWDQPNGSSCSSLSTLVDLISTHSSSLPNHLLAAINSVRDGAQMMEQVDLFLRYSENVVRVIRNEFENLEVTQAYRSLQGELEKRRQRFGVDALKPPSGFKMLVQNDLSAEAPPDIEIAPDKHLGEAECADLVARALIRKARGRNKRRLRRLRDRSILRSIYDKHSLDSSSSVLPSSNSAVRDTIVGSSSQTDLADLRSPSPESQFTPSLDTSSALPHLNPRTNAPRMVSVTDKSSTARTAYAVGRILFSHSGTYASLMSHYTSSVPSSEPSLKGPVKLRKGDPLAVVHIAGIQAAKMLPQLVPLCHPILITHVDVDVRIIPPFNQASDPVSSPLLYDSPTPHGGIFLSSRVSTFGPTGVEMEALAAVSGAGLAAVDMLKAVDKHMCMDGMKVVGKIGGKSGEWWEKGWEDLGKIMDDGQ